MLTSDFPGSPGIAGGSAGFSMNERTASFSSTCITPNPLASVRGTSRQPTVTSAFWSTCWRSMIS